MKYITVIAILLFAAWGIWFWKFRPIKMSGEQFAAMLTSHMPQIKIAELGTFHLSNGSWWQDASTFQTPDKKPVLINFISPNSRKKAPPTSDQIKLSQLIKSNLGQLWPDIVATYTAHLKEAKDPASLDKSQDWEINVHDSEQRWTISFKEPAGELSFYELSYIELTRDSGVATY
jgi:hypothetical protein